MKGKEKLRKSQRIGKIQNNSIKLINKENRDNNRQKGMIEIKGKLNQKDLEGNLELLKFKLNQLLKV